MKRNLAEEPAEIQLAAGALIGAALERRSRRRLTSGNFGSFGSFAQAVARSARDGAVDKRLIRAPSGGNEGDPTAGGFAVAEAWAATIVGSMYDEAVIAPLCDRRTTSRPLANHKVPAIDETSRADGSRYGGAASFWVAEGASVSTSFPRFRNIELSAKKLRAVAYVTNELLSDAPMLESHLIAAFGGELGFKLDAAILNGDGVGKPLGIANSPALVTVAADAAQKSKTITATNISTMWTALPVGCRRRGVWITGEDSMARLQDGMAPGGGFSGIFMPAGAAGNALPLLYGRPVITAEQSPAVGVLGDILLLDPSQYIILDGGLKTALSLDCSFVNDQAVFSATLRVDGKPAWASPITSYVGASQRSPFVAVAAR